MKEEQVKIVITGHIDHGKSTLIGRLLYDTNSLPEDKMKEIKNVSQSLGRQIEFAYVIDNLEEEREQQLTIDTAQLFFKTDKRKYVIIDSPGHKEFIKNMITGASQADLAILLLDANEGIMDQTKRHPYIIKMLGINNLIVVINKMDLVCYDSDKFEKMKELILNTLLKIDLVPDYIIPISASNGENILKKSDNMKWYDGLTILEALDKFELNHDEKTHFRFPIQDIYELDDKKILAGKILSGTIKVDDVVNILPVNKVSRIKSIETFNSKKEYATTGENIGLTLYDDENIEAGMILSDNKIPLIKKEFEARLFWLSNKDLKVGEELIIKCATQESKCIIKKINERIDSSNLEIIERDAKILKDTEVGEVIIESEKDLVLENFNETPELGRFVIIKGYDTAGAGIIAN